MKSNFYPGLSIIVFSFVLFNCLGKSPAGGKRIVAILQSGFSNSSSNNPGSGSNCCSGSFTIGGSVSGLSGGTVILTNTGNFEAKSISANGAFSFSTAIADNTAYSVVATSHPSMQNCSITNGSGTISSAIVTNIAVSCKLGNQYGPLVGGSIFSNLTLTPSLAPLNPGGFCALTNSSLALSQFNNPNGITTDGRYFYVADTGNQVIRRIDPITDAVTTIAGTAGVTGSADGGPGTGQFNALRGIATDGTYLYVADY